MSTIDSAQDTQQLAGTRWQLDPSASSAEFRVPNVWGLASVKGRFQRIEGWLEVDDDHEWRMIMALDADSLDTGNPRRDKHLRSADFFDVAQHPEVRFLSRGARDDGDGRLHVEGELEAAGGSVPLQVEATVEHADGRLELDATATVDHRRLGMTWSPLGVIRSPTAVRIRARLRPEG
jgi:polyisoprenoid-binding protein YceI